MIMFNKLHIHYWGSDFEDRTDLKHQAEYAYSEEKRNEVVNAILNAGLNVMLAKTTNGDDLVVYIDNKKFQQR